MAHVGSIAQGMLCIACLHLAHRRLPWLYVFIARTLAGGESDQSTIVLSIGSAQSLEVLRTSRIFIAQLSTTPAEPILFEVTGQDKISVEPREPTVTVGKGMDEDEPMVHADRILDRRIGPVVEPVARVVNENAQLDTDL